MDRFSLGGFGCGGFGFCAEESFGCVIFSISRLFSVRNKIPSPNGGVTGLRHRMINVGLCVQAQNKQW